MDVRFLENLFSSASGFQKQLLLWARLRFGLGAAAEFTTCEALDVQHLAGDLTVVFVLMLTSLC